MSETIGNYRVTGELARGGMGVVYVAEHLTMPQQVVVKKLLPELSQQGDVVERFFQEARAAAAIDDPGIVRVFDQGVLADGSAYIVMERLKGESLAARLVRGPLPPVLASTFLRQAARALGAAHQRGIIHRDLKPDNLFLVPDPDLPGGERIKVLDFGIAKLAGDTRVKTMTRMPMGTPDYMSPEQWSSSARVDLRTDVYALGIILYEMVVGRRPFPGPGLPELMDQHRYAPVPAPSAVDPALAPFDPVVARTMAKSADDRFASMDELIQALPGGLPSMPHAVVVPSASAAMAAAPPAAAQPIGTAPTATRPSGSGSVPVAGPSSPTTLSAGAGQQGGPPPSRRWVWPVVVGVVGAAGVATAVLIATSSSGGDQEPPGVAAGDPADPDYVPTWDPSGGGPMPADPGAPAPDDAGATPAAGGDAGADAGATVERGAGAGRKPNDGSIDSDLHRALSGSNSFASLTGTADLDDGVLYDGLIDFPDGGVGLGLGMDRLGRGGGGDGIGTIGHGDTFGVPTLGHGTGGTGTGYGTGRGGLRGRTTDKPKVRIGSASATGDLDKAIIRRYIRRKLPQITSCYEKELAVHPGLEGTVTAQFTISPQGAVISSTASGVNRAVSSCVAGVVKAIQFPKPRGGGVVNVRYPFAFGPA